MESSWCKAQNATEDRAMGMHMWKRWTRSETKNISFALASVGCTVKTLVKVTVFVRDMSKLADYRRARP
jgi:enamine deaminase RidA (YjgF/YER057c/UK114 family)